MSVEKRNRRFRPWLAAAVAAVGLGALALPVSSADAQLYFGIGPGGFNIGIGTPYYSYSPYYYSPYYYGYGAPYYYPW